MNYMMFLGGEVGFYFIERLVLLNFVNYVM